MNKNNTKIREYNSKEQEVKILENVKFPFGLNKRQIARITLWSIFNKKKYNVFLNKLEDGMQVKFAYEFIRTFKK